jgi:hypothetical protein
VHAEGNEDEQHELVEKAQQALVAIRIGNDGAALDVLAPDAGRRLVETRALVLLLFGACSTMVATLGDGGAARVLVQFFDEDGEEVSIAPAHPRVRTAARTLLAEVHGNSEAAAEQVEIALASAAPDEVESLVLQALRWTVRLSAECLERDLPVAGWIADALES